MQKVIWADEALADLERLDSFLRPNSPRAAERAVEAVRDAVAGLRQFPEMGRPAANMPIGYREIIVPFGSGAYLVLYRYLAAPVMILAIRHAREERYRAPQPDQP
jgi:plasmid stabilization system protein ParE